jgi:aminopeptidase N
MEKTQDRLLTHFVPINYSLSLNLQRQERLFNGVVTINGNLEKGAEHIVLHSKELGIESVSLDGKAADFASSDNDELFISQSGLKSGRHNIVITYSAKITDAMHGMYPCYFEHDGIKKELLATQFESHHAREVFPCIDEPAAKATFDVTLTTETNITVLGNMPIKLQEEESGSLVTTFDTTPIMSTYLLAWVTGELQKKSGRTKRGVEVNVWSTPTQSLSSLDFSLDIAIRSIDFYETYFDTEYPLPKSDHVALPDFSSGAMENWGLITYREIALLADPATTGISSKQYIATVVAHELAHQWFGNLVTMKWWNNLWLNESFATLMEYLTVDALHPEWNMWLEFSTNESILALRRDSIDGVQAVQVDVNHPDEISTLFDGAIVYAKGARLLRMLQHFVGNDAFQVGLKHYFKEFAYKNTEANDLWDAIATSSGQNITSIMNTWISQPGYPVVIVEQRNNDVTLSQKQFYVGPHENSNTLWPIPLNASESSFPILLESEKVVIPYTSDSPIRLNREDSAHFITSYDKRNLSLLLNEVRTGKMSVLDRLQLLHEATLLARGGMMASVDLLDIVSSYKDETAEPVWNILFIALGELRKFVEFDKEAEKKLRILSGNMAASQYKRLGWVSKGDEPEDDTKLRSTIISLMLYSESQQAIDQAVTIYKNTELEEIDPELRTLVISSVTRHSDGKIVDELLSVYKSSSSSELKQDISVGITSTRVKEKIMELLEDIKDSDIIRPQDAARWFVYLIRGKESRDLSWRWIRNNWQWVIDTFGGDKSYDDYPRYSATALTTQSQLEEYVAFFRPMKDITALSRVIAMGISEIEGRVSLIEKDGPAVRKALKAL